MDCPNCVKPWKCNGPHLEMMSDRSYSSSEGYYFFENEIWVFLPFEKSLNSNQLIEIAETLKHLNSKIIS